MFTTIKLPVKTAVALGRVLERELSLDYDEFTNDRSVSFEELREFNDIRLTMLDYWRCIFE